MKRDLARDEATKALSAFPDLPGVRSKPPPRSRAFSMIELAIVVAIIAIIGAIAVPRFSGFVERSREKRLVMDIGRLQSALDMYAEEHGGKNAAINAGGTKGAPAAMIARLTGHTNADGGIDDAGIFGPYLQRLPDNAISGKSGLRIDGAAAGANTHAWRFDSVSGIIEPDHDGDIVDDSGRINFSIVGAGQATDLGGSLGGTLDAGP